MNTIEHSPLGCNCKSDHRTLVLLAKNFAVEYPEMVKFHQPNWTYHAELGAMQIEVGSNSKWSGISEIINFLGGALLDKNRLSGLRAVWINGHRSLKEQLFQLIHEAEPLTNFISNDSSPLMEILQARRIETWFQPVISAKTCEIWGYECLMRGRTSAGDLVSAPQMLKWAAQEYLTFMLDRVCREVHLENIGTVNKSGQLRFLINFLPTAIYQPEFCLQTSLAAATRCGVAPEQIIFEVVETEQIDDREHLKNILRFYRNSGFGVALDDLGSGYSGLSLMAELRPDLIKIDRELVVKSVSSQIHKEICAALVKLGKDNGQLVLAEGIEAAEEKLVMDALEVDLYQGYLFGKPTPGLHRRECTESPVVT